MKQAVNMYKGDVLVSAAGEHWLIPTSAHYNLRYLGMMSELLRILAEGKDYHNLHRYAAQALTVNPENKTAYYWLIYSMVKMNAIELAKTQLQIAQENLTDEDYFDLVSELKKIDISPTTNLFRNERVNG